jgi:hypothetical protein
VIQLSRGAYVVCVSPRVPARNLQELLAHARENPGKLTFASAGNGSHLHIVTEYLFGMAKVKATHVPYRGTGPAVTDLLAGNAQGILNVWLGSYKRLDGSQLQGPGIRDWVASKDSALAEKTTRQITQSVEAANAIPAPFDQAIQGARDSASRAKIQATIDSLVQQSKDLVEAANAVGITQLNLVDPKAN